MRKLILPLLIISLLTTGLYFTRTSSAAVTTTIANAGTPLNPLNNYSWTIPLRATNCATSGFRPMTAYTLNITTPGSYTFTMNASGFTGQVFVYQSAFNPLQPCQGIVNQQSGDTTFITGSSVTVSLNASASNNRWVVVFSATTILANGTFSASVDGPAAVSLVPNVSTAIAPANTPLNAQDNYTWKYPLKQSCTSLSGTVPFAAYTFDVTTAGLYTFTMNTSGFTGRVHLYSTFDPTDPCTGIQNSQDASGDVITSNSVTIPIATFFSSSVRRTVVFSAQDTGQGGTFSASISGPAAVTPLPGILKIASQPGSKSVSKNCVQTLSVYATGPTPQTFQWYEGVSGDLTHSIIIPGANSNTYLTPALLGDKSYWVRVTHGNDHVDSDTVKFKVYDTTNTPFKGSLDSLQTWNLKTTNCNLSGPTVHYSAFHLRIPVSGQYRIHLGNHSFGSYAITTYSGSFDATQPCINLNGGVSGSDLNTFLSGGQDTIVVVSATTPGVVGNFEGYITSNDSCTLPETIEDALIISGNPLDQAVTPGNNAALTFAYIGGSNGVKTVQWYKGVSGDTSQPIAGANSTVYTTPTLSQTNNETTYYYYWARVDDPDSFTHADTGTGVVSVINPPITYSDVLTQCDEQYPQVNGPTTYYKIFPFKVSTSGSYTFNLNASGFTSKVALYQGVFLPAYPNVNYYGPGGTQTLLASTNNYYLVITTTGAGQTGSFTLNVSGPSLVVPTLRPEIKTQPTDRIIFRDQTATLSVAATSPAVSYQWFTGSCDNKTAVSGANLSSYTTPPLTDYKDYWIKVSYGVMYVNSNIAHVRIRPQAITDTYIIDEDTPLNVAASGLLANDKKADSKTLTAFKVTDPTLGTRTLNGNGSLSYTPNSNVNGADVFMYKVSDATLDSNPENVPILILAINDAPVRTGGSVDNHTFNEDAAASTLHLAALNYSPGGGADEASQQLTYRVTAVPPASAGNVMLANNTTVVTTSTTYTLAEMRGMNFKPAANSYGGPHPFTFIVTDDGTSRGAADPKSITQSLNIMVNAVADTPSATGATTNEDVKTTSGLVLSRNQADGAEVGYFKIASIKNGTLYKNDGVTQINDEQFITYAEGQAGLKFKPNANLFSPATIFSFEVQASLTNSTQGLGGNAVTVSITVNPVAETPSITNAATFVNTQTGSGLVITRNSADGTEIACYKISSITNGTLYKADGTTRIGEGQFIPATDGTAGLKFTPAQDSIAPGSFLVQGSADTSGNGLGLAATASITVSKYGTSTTITSDTPAPSYLDQQVTVNYSVLNTSGGPAPSGDVVVTVSGGAETCTGTVAAGSCTLTLTTGGNPRTITATYGGNSQFNGSTGTKDHIVNTCTQNTVVTSTGDDGTTGTLRYIVAHTCAGSTITFDPTVFNPAAGPYVISLGAFGNVVGNLLIDKNLTIKGPGANILTVRRSPLTRVPRFRIFNINSGAIVKISGLTIRNGFANGTAFNEALVGRGGGILNSGTLTLEGCAVVGNKAGVQPDTSGLGGGIYNSGSLTVINSTVSGNDAVTDGGGIYLQAGSTASIINSTLSGNTTPGNGGGILLSGTASIINSTVANNTATASGGGIYNDTGTLSIGNTIVANNTSATGPDVRLLSGIINTTGNNLIGKNDGAGTAFLPGSPNASADIVGTLNSPVIALLGSLADNGGATATHLPLPGSPALDSGSNANLPPDAFDLDGDGNTTETLPVDQRGQSRITNTTVDIGSTEVSYSIAATSGAGQDAVIDSSFVTPLQATVIEAGKPKSGASVTFTAPGTGASGTFNGDLTATVSTDDSGVATAPAFTANGITGIYNVVASLDAATLSATFSLTNTPAQAQVILGDLTQSYDGTPKSASATTVPSGLPVALTYDGSLTPPTNAGAYQVAAMISDPNYSGQTTGTLNIGKAVQTINFNAPADKTYGDADFTVSATSSSALTVSLSGNGQCLVNDNTVHITGAGSCTITASQAGDSNHNAAPDVMRVFEIAQAATTTAVTSSVNPSTAGQSVTFTAIVTSPAGTPTGTIQFLDGGDPINGCTSVPMTGGQATCQTSALPVGNHVITAQYSNGGDGNFNTGTGSLNGNPQIVIQPQLDLSAGNARAAETSSGTAPMFFTVTLSSSSPGGVTVNYATADDDASGAHPATGGASCDDTVDYQIASGSITFAAGESLKTVMVNVCADTVAGEADETFRLNLSNATGATITGAQATGMITQANPAGALLISELRTSGPGGAGDDFVELYNNTDSALTVTASDSSAGYGVFKPGADCNAAAVRIAMIPNGTVIPARGHYLLVGSQYSLSSYAAGDQPLLSGIEDDQGVAVFSTADVANLSTAARLDAVGFGSNAGGICDLLGEGLTLGASAGSAAEHSLVRKPASGTLQDTNDNASDFLLVSTTPDLAVGGNNEPTLGAPGPENMTSPIQRNGVIKSSLIDPSAASTASPNRVRSAAGANPTNAAYGTLDIRRKFTNTTGATVNSLRFRVVDITTRVGASAPPAGTADLRLLTSTETTATLTGGGMITVTGTTLDAPAQTVGGGFNSSATVSLPGGGLANGASINLRFVLGVQVQGNFRFLVNVEGLSAPATNNGMKVQQLKALPAAVAPAK